ncbi:MAG: RNA polymerase sigma factor [Clostridia bacterium]|nr:RNA polymerase sigma factor [Clostridia bacterium]
MRHKDKLIYFIYRYVKSIDIAEDLAQDVFVYLLIHKENYDFNYSLKTYLYTIAKSKALNYLKREKRIVAINENDIYDVQTLEEKVFLNERKNNLKQAMLKLKPEYQSAVYLADIEELSYKEIGQIMKKSESGIKSLIFRARKSLEEILRKEAGKYEG